MVDTATRQPGEDFLPTGKYEGGERVIEGCQGKGGRGPTAASFRGCSGHIAKGGVEEGGVFGAAKGKAVPPGGGGKWS